MKKYFKVMHIHSSCSSWSSNDKSLYREVYNIPKDASYQEEDKLIGIYTFEDKTYYRNIRDSATSEQMKELVSKYVGEGWSTKRPIEFDEYIERCKQKRILARKKGRYVIVDQDAFYENFNRDQLMGSLSSELWNDPECIKYTSSICFGYYGHSARTHEIDLYIEKEFRDHKASTKEIHYWMFSTYARHAMDLHEEEDFETVWKPYISKNVSEWILQAKKMISEEEK